MFFYFLLVLCSFLDLGYIFAIGTSQHTVVAQDLVLFPIS